MKPIYEMYMAHIELTSHCMHDCIYCSRYIRHLPASRRQHMTLDVVEKCAIAYKDWPNLIGVIGGEPTLHPQFAEACEIMLKYIAPEKLCLFTVGGKLYEKHRAVIEKTFKHAVHVNEHKPEQTAMCLHQPATIAIKDVVPDAEIRRKLIDNCWVQKTWCPTATMRGAFFCEVAYGIDQLFNMGGGYAIEPGWWNKTPAQYQDQVCRYCDLCGMAIPMPRDRQDSAHEKWSYTTLQMARLAGLDLKCAPIEVFNHQFTVKELRYNLKTWDPNNYRQDKGIPDRPYQNFVEI